MAAGAQLQPRPLTSEKAEQYKGQVLNLYLAAGIGFVVLAGVLGGLSVISISPLLAQAHGHAELFGFIGTLLLGFGFYSTRHSPKMEACARTCWALWTAGVLTRCIAATSAAHWRTLLLASAGLELLAAGVFAAAWGMGGRRDENEASGYILMGANVGLVVAAVANAAGAFTAARAGQVPVFPHEFEQRFYLLCTWGFMAPLAWGASVKWLPQLLGLQPTRTRLLLAAFLLDAAGIAAAWAGKIHLAAVLLLHAAIFVPAALRVFRKSEGESRMPTLPYARIAFAWLRVSATLAVWASVNNSVPVWGASRHALMVGFVFTLILVMGEASRFAFSRRLAKSCMLLLNVGCLLHVISEILIHERVGAWARYLLGFGGTLELLATLMFAAGFAASTAKGFAVVEVAPSQAD
jgi:hypothetical protein